jgi:hypothetical protein
MCVCAVAMGYLCLTKVIYMVQAMCVQAMYYVCMYVCMYVCHVRMCLATVPLLPLYLFYIALLEAIIIYIYIYIIVEYVQRDIKSWVSIQR